LTLINKTHSYNSTTERCPILSKVTNGRDIHSKLVRYIVIQRWSAKGMIKYSKIRIDVLRKETS